MGIEGCDCSEFERREGNISCEDLMTGQISSLKGKSMSPHLVEMDGREYEVIRIEEAELTAIKKMEWNKVQLPRIGKCWMLMIASIIGMVVSGALSIGPFFALSAFVGVFSLMKLIFSSGPTVAQYHKIQDIEDNRLARLRNKVEILEDKMTTANEFKEQLRSAKDFFKTKYDLYLGLRHRPVTNVSQRTVVYPIYTRA